MDWSRRLQCKSFADELAVSSIVWCSVVSVPGRRIWCCSKSHSLDAAYRRDPDHLSGSCDGMDGWTFLCLYADAGTGKGMVSGCGYKGDDRNKYQCCWSSGWHTGIFFLLWCGISEKPYPGDVCSE